MIALASFVLALSSLMDSGRLAQQLVLEPFPLEGHHRVLILAPHSDDETLGAGGLIQQALQMGMEVRVVIATNGDGYLFATMRDFYRFYPAHKDFIRMGALRQQESLHALQVLGVQAENVIFLSYPDRGTPSLWNNYWSSGAPYWSPYNGQTRSPYSLTFNPRSNYSGESMLSDLITILEEYRPDLVIYPHPADVHPDHWGLSAFTRLALALAERQNIDFHPDAFAYLVHRPDFPSPKGYFPNQGLFPPPALLDLNTNWYELAMTRAQMDVKVHAVQQYHSQLPLLRTLLDSFVREDEVFGQVETASLPIAKDGEWSDPGTWRGMDQQTIDPIQKDPILDIISRRTLSSSDLVSMYLASRPDGLLWMCAQVRGNAEPELYYTLRLTGIGPQGVIHYVARNMRLQPGWSHAVRSGHFICTQVDQNKLGNPWMIFAGAETSGLGVGILDQVAWQLVTLPAEMQAGRPPSPTQ